MYVESISTLHSIDNNSARTLKEKPLTIKKIFIRILYRAQSTHERTHRKISHGGSHGVDVEK